AGCAVVVATHDLAAAERQADGVVILDRGRVVACGPPLALMAGVAARPSEILGTPVPGREATGAQPVAGKAGRAASLVEVFRRATGQEPPPVQPARRSRDAGERR
ncbi:MAG: hypothetical protein M3O15_00545, partial [Acidobacteriota bacterium]|nr:hypothetical protein [Acidobacteriota bacterium]